MVACAACHKHDTPAALQGIRDLNQATQLDAWVEVWIAQLHARVCKNTACELSQADQLDARVEAGAAQPHAHMRTSQQHGTKGSTVASTNPPLLTKGRILCNDRPYEGSRGIPGHPWFDATFIS
eukprot:1154923-Pelagomonas_calceolata.AAC.4